MRYTICFIKRGKHLLLLNRVCTPNMGLWNGVGGKLLEGETPEQCILREALEETGIHLPSVLDCGTVTWSVDGVDWGGMHLYTADMPDICYETPRPMREGILDWKPLSWIMDVENQGVVSNIRHFLPYALQGKAMQHHCRYKQGQLVEVISTEMPVMQN